MFQVLMAERLLNDLQQNLLSSGYVGAQKANDLRLVRQTLSAMAGSFNHTQNRAAAKAVPDGRAETLISALSPTDGEFGWPRYSGRLLQGLKLKNRIGLPNRAPSPLSTAPNNRILDQHSYLCGMTIGPPQARRMGNYCCLFLYLGLINTGFICWIGENDDIDADGYSFVVDATDDFRNFGLVNPVYQKRLVDTAQRFGWH